MAKSYVVSKLPKVTAPVEVAQSQPVFLTDRYFPPKKPMVPIFIVR